MKTPLYAGGAAALAILVALTGCSPGGGNQPSTTNAPTEPPATTNAAATNGVTSLQQRQKFMALAQHNLARLDAGISNLVLKAGSYAGATRTHADQTLDELRQQRERVQTGLESVKTAAAENWNEARAAFTSSLSALQARFEKAATQFNDYDAEKATASMTAPRTASSN